MKIKCDVCDKMVRQTKMDIHLQSQEHRLKHMTSLIKKQMENGALGSIDPLSSDHYTVVEVDPRDPRFNSDSMEFDTGVKDFDPNYRNRVYSYDEIVSFFSAKSAQEFEKTIRNSVPKIE